MGTITNKASSLQIYIKLGRTLLYNDMQNPIPLFPGLGHATRASPLLSGEQDHTRPLPQAKNCFPPVL